MSPNFILLNTQIKFKIDVIHETIILDKLLSINKVNHKFIEDLDKKQISYQKSNILRLDKNFVKQYEYEKSASLKYGIQCGYM